jgi:glycosyltransferase involved in cell wall biosynthesis
MMIASMAESGGAEMLARNLSLAYVRAGHTCHIVYMSDAESLGVSADYERAFQAEMDAAGISYTKLGHRCRRMLPLGAFRLRRTLAAFRPDVFHIHLPYGLLFQAIGLLRLPTVYTHHNMIFKFTPRLFKVFDRYVDRYVAICRACEALLQPHVRRQIALIYNGVPEAFALGGPRSKPAVAPTVLSVGNLTAQKNYPGVVAIAKAAVEVFRQRGVSLRFQIAGDGPDRSGIVAAIDAAGLEDNVALLGARRDVPALMAQADIMLNFSDYEGLPISLIEATRSGLPVIATAVGGTPEIVEDGVNGALVSPGDVTAAVAALDKVLSQSEQYSRYSAAAIEKSQRFCLTECAEAHLNVYSQVVAR